MTYLLSASGSFDDNGCILDSVDNTTMNIIDEEEANDNIISQTVEEGDGGEASVSEAADRPQYINTNDEEKTLSHSTNANNTPPQPIIPTTPNSKRHNLYKLSIIIFAISILCIIIGVSVKVSNDKSSSKEQVAKDTNLIITEEETSSTTLLRSTNAPSPATPSFETYAGSTVLVSNEEILESTTNEDEESIKLESNTPSTSSQPSNTPTTSSSSIGADITSWINAFNSLTDTNDKEEILAAIQGEMEEEGDDAVAELPATLSAANETTVNTTTTTTSTISTSTTSTTTTVTQEPSKPTSTSPTTQSPTTLQPSSSPSSSPIITPKINVSTWVVLANQAISNQTATTNDSTTSVSMPEYTCLTAEECDIQRQIMGFNFYMIGESQTKGCFYKDTVAYFGINGNSSELYTTNVSGNEDEDIRIWCDGTNQAVFNGIAVNTTRPTQSPSRQPVVTTPPPQSSAPSTSPTTKPTEPTPPCLNINTYNEIDKDINDIKNSILNAKDRSHFLGGIVRLAAHDFMDFNRNSNDRMGSDGCFDRSHPANAGLPEDVWCTTCWLTILYETKYKSFVSRADFWIITANAVIRQTSVDNALDLRDTFVWGRQDRESCPGSGERLPTPAGCEQVENVFIQRMGLGWRDAVALMGAHTIGRADREVCAIWNLTAHLLSVICFFNLAFLLSHTAVLWSSWLVG